MADDVNETSPHSLTILATGPTEAERVAALKVRLVEALAPVLALAIEANSAGLDVNFNFSRDRFGQLSVVPIISKVF